MLSVTDINFAHTGVGMQAMEEEKKEPHQADESVMEEPRRCAEAEAVKYCK